MKSDLVAQLEFLGNSCNSSKSNMATPVQACRRKIITFSIIKLDRRLPGVETTHVFFQSQRNWRRFYTKFAKLKIVSPTAMTAIA